MAILEGISLLEVGIELRYINDVASNLSEPTRASREVRCAMVGAALCTTRQNLRFASTYRFYENFGAHVFIQVWYP